MTEGQDFQVLHECLTGIEENQFRSVAAITSPEQDGIENWPEAVPWMLRSLSTDEISHNVVLAMQDVHQLPTEVEGDYYFRLSYHVVPIKTTWVPLNRFPSPQSTLT